MGRFVDCGVAGLWVLVATLLVVSLGNSRSSAKGLLMPLQERAKIRAPELTGDRGWLNTDKPLSLPALKGKVVLLDFWTQQRLKKSPRSGRQHKAWGGAQRNPSERRSGQPARRAAALLLKDQIPKSLSPAARP